MLKCIALDDYQNVALKLANWSNLKVDIEISNITYHIDKEDELVRLLYDYTIIIIMRERTPFPASLIRSLPNLKLLITTGMRNSSIDLEVAVQQGITVCGTRSFSEPPLELTWALILALTRNIIFENNAFRNKGNWQSTIGVDLYGKTLGIIGLGKIGAQMAKVAKAFGMQVIAWSPHLTKERALEHEVSLAASKLELLANSDFVSIHLVLSESTKNLIAEADLKSMKSDAFIINTSRAGIINQEALLKVLREGLIAGAGLDVYEIEPLPLDHELRSMPNVVATPHLGYVSLRNYSSYYQEALENINAFLIGSPIRKIG